MKIIFYFIATEECKELGESFYNLQKTQHYSYRNVNFLNINYELYVSDHKKL